MEDDEIKLLMKQFRLESDDGNQARFARMSKCERFRIGKQWDPDVLSRYEAKRKHALTINMCHPVINQLTGTEVQNPRDIRVHNVKGSTKTRAKILTALTKNVMDTSFAQRQKSSMFEDGTTTGCGWIGVSEDFEHDPFNGDLIVKKYDPFMVHLDPNCTVYDINAPKNGAKYVIVDEWEDKDKIYARYPKKKAELENVDYGTNDNKGRFAGFISSLFHGSGPGEIQDDYRDRTSSDDDIGKSDKAKLNFRISTIWWKKWQPVAALTRVDDPLDVKIYYKPEDIKKAKELATLVPDQFKFIDKDRDGLPLTAGILNKTVMVGDVLLYTKEDPLNGVHLFLLVPYYPYFVNGYMFGVIENLIGPQEHTNFSWSTELNLIKQLANTGWKVKSAVSKMIDWLKSHGSEDGIVINEADYGGSVEKIKPNEYSPGYANMTERGKQYISEIAAVRTESPETAKDRVASAIRLKQSASMTGLAMIFSNYDYTVELLGNVVVELIRSGKYYSRDEMLAIIDREDIIDPEMMQEARTEVMADYGQELQTMQAGTPEELQVLQQALKKVDEIAQYYAISKLIEEMENLNKGRFGIKVSLAPMAETYKAIKAMEVMELNQMLINSGLQPLSRRQLIEAADPPNKEAILAEDAAMATAAA